MTSSDLLAFVSLVGLISRVSFRVYSRSNIPFQPSLPSKSPFVAKLVGSNKEHVPDLQMKNLSEKSGTMHGF